MSTQQGKSQHATFPVEETQLEKQLFMNLIHGQAAMSQLKKKGMKTPWVRCARIRTTLPNILHTHLSPMRKREKMYF